MNEMIQLNSQNQRVSLSRYMIEQIMKRLISIISDQASSFPPNAQNPNFTIFVFTQFHSSYVTLLTGFFIGSCIEIYRGSIQLTIIKNVLSPVDIKC